jgi:hypothetical protein
MLLFLQKADLHSRKETAHAATVAPDRWLDQATRGLDQGGE